jgi:uncharacterized SAM-binding protein YcdF (DUF218 family)
MFRALRSFRKQGIQAVPSACHYSAHPFDWDVRQFLPSTTAFQQHERAFHEWLGFAWYWVNGYL